MYGTRIFVIPSDARNLNLCRASLGGYGVLSVACRPTDEGKSPYNSPSKRRCARRRWGSYKCGNVTAFIDIKELPITIHARRSLRLRTLPRRGQNRSPLIRLPTAATFPHGEGRERGWNCPCCAMLPFGMTMEALNALIILYLNYSGEK